MVQDPTAFDQRETVQLRDGASVDVVTMRPADAARLVRFHHTLSPDTTYLRFFSFHPELSADELYRFTHVDHLDREAIVVVKDAEIIAVARFDRVAGETDAEVAFVVADSWQGRGLGTLLFDRLARRARRVGIDRFTAQTFRDNARMQAVFRNTGLPMTQRGEAEILHVTIDLTSIPGDESA
jgi:RimJ/RimL family protein N-acetyltransferase